MLSHSRWADELKCVCVGVCVDGSEPGGEVLQLRHRHFSAVS